MTEYRTYFNRATTFVKGLRSTLEWMNMEADGRNSATDGFNVAMSMCNMEDPFDTQAMNDLCTGFEHEQIEMYGRYAEAKSQDRLSTQLYHNLLRPLDGCHKYMVEHYSFKKDDNGCLLDESGQLMTKAGEEDALAAFETCRTANKLRLSIQRLLHSYAPHLWEKYRGLPTSTDQVVEVTEPGPKLKFSCNPATAGFIIATLVEKGYITPPFKGDGTPNDTELSRLCLQLFEFENDFPSVDSMRKNFNLQSPNANQFSQDNRDMFKIPHKSRLIQSNASRNSPNP